MPARIPPQEQRTPEELRFHYEVEKKLAQRLRGATREERRQLYTAAYDELFQRVPHHPQVVARRDPAAGRVGLRRQLRLLRPFLHADTVFLEIGPGDCSLSLAVAARVRRVIAVDVTDRLAPDDPPRNFELVLSDGCSIPVAPGSVTLAFSHQLIEHLHPEDADEQLRAIHRALAPGGLYVCVTPTRLGGPHDISRYFDDVATGFHLREYTAGELRPLFERAGFSQLRLRIGGGGTFLAAPLPAIVLLERLLLALPPGARRRLACAQPLRMLLGIKLVARKPHEAAS